MFDYKLLPNRSVYRYLIEEGMFPIVPYLSSTIPNWRLIPKGVKLEDPSEMERSYPTAR